MLIVSTTKLQQMHFACTGLLAAFILDDKSGFDMFFLPMKYNEERDDYARRYNNRLYQHGVSGEMVGCCWMSIIGAMRDGVFVDIKEAPDADERLVEVIALSTDKLQEIAEQVAAEINK